MKSPRPPQIKTLSELEDYMNSDIGIVAHSNYNFNDFVFFSNRLNDVSIGKLINRDRRTIKAWRSLLYNEAKV